MKNSFPGTTSATVIRIGFSCFVSLLLLCLLARRGPILHVGDTLCLLLGLGLITVILSYLHKPENPGLAAERPSLPAELWVVAFIMLYLSSGAAENNWFFFPRWSISSKSPESSWLLRSLFLTLVLGVGIRLRPGMLNTRSFICMALVFMTACFLSLGMESGYQPLYRVDHSSFYYRFASFVETFPRPDFYDPHWNGGKPVPYLVASGTWALALVWLPFLMLIPVGVLYTPMIAVTFLLLVPLSGATACRLLGGSRRAGWISFLLFMVPGKRFFTHILHYGTTPSIFCLCLFPLILALLWKLLHAQTLRSLAGISLALIGVSGITLCWPGALLPGIPLFLALIFVLNLWTPRRFLWMCISAGALILLLHPLALVPIRYSPIDTFVRFSESKSTREMIEGGLQLLSGLLQGIHPVIVLFGACTGFLDPNRTRGRMMGIFIISAALIAGWGEEFSPLLQWERLIIPAALVGATAAALGLDRLFIAFESLPASKRKRTLATPVAWMLSLLILGGYQGVKIYGNPKEMDFQTLPAHTRELVDWLKQEVPEGGRILIAGKAVHGYGGAKVAALPLLTGREMMSCDYYGFSPKLVEFQYPPRKVLNKGPEGVFRFLGLYNVTHVMTYHQSWKDAFNRHPDYYTPAYQNGRVQVYAVNRTPSMFLEGTGQVQASFSRLHLTLDPDQDVVVLKYNWSMDFKVSAPAELFPVPQEFDIRLIGIRPHGARTLTLEHRP